jgi:hypothetical protein
MCNSFLQRKFGQQIFQLYVLWWRWFSRMSKRSCVCVRGIEFDYFCGLVSFWFFSFHFIVSMYFVDARNERASCYVKEEQDRNYTSNIFISKLWFIVRFSHYYIDIIFWKIHCCVKSRTKINWSPFYNSII